LRTIGLEQLHVLERQLGVGKRLYQQRILLGPFPGEGNLGAFELGDRSDLGFLRHKNRSLIENIDRYQGGRQARRGQDCRAHARRCDLQLSGGERLVFRRPVRERSKHYLDLVLFFDRLEKSRSVRDKNRLSRGLDSEIDDFFRLRRRAKANRRRKREYWIIRSADHGTLPDLLKTLVRRHPRLSGRHRQALCVISKDRAYSKTSQQRVARRQRTLP